MMKKHVGVFTLVLVLMLAFSSPIVTIAENETGEKKPALTVQENNTDLLLTASFYESEQAIKVINMEPKIVQVEKLSCSESDLFYLAAAVCREAGGECEEIQLLVANVIINRVGSSIYPDTIYEVLTQKRQYGTMWKDGISFPEWATEETKERCYNVARRVLEGERFCPENVLYQAEFKQGSGIFKKYPGYYFCF